MASYWIVGTRRTYSLNLFENWSLNLLKLILGSILVISWSEITILWAKYWAIFSVLRQKNCMLYGKSAFSALVNETHQDKGRLWGMKSNFLVNCTAFNTKVKVDLGKRFLRLRFSISTECHFLFVDILKVFFPIVALIYEYICLVVMLRKWSLL